MKLKPFKTLVNPPFSSLVKYNGRMIVLWGGRGSGKSVAALRKHIIECITAPYFKCICIRKIYETVEDSLFEALKYEIEELGLTDLFEFRKSPFKISCFNGNTFLFRGMDKPGKLKGIKEPSHAWYEEGNQLTYDDFIAVSTTLRTSKAKYLQETFSFNPESTEPDYKDFWIYRIFFEGYSGKSFDGVTPYENPVTGETEHLNYRVIHSTYKDNEHLTHDYIAVLESIKKENPYYYKVYTLGEWGNKLVGEQFYKKFSLDAVTKIEYQDHLPLHISFDENVNPYMSCTIWQHIERRGVKYLWQIDEICLTHPRNTLKDTCREFKKRYSQHTEGLFLYGDRTSIKQDVKLEKGQNFFTLIESELSDYRPTRRLPTQNPNVKSRGEFINDIFCGDIPGIEIKINNECKNSIADYINVVQASDGTKLKKKERNKESGVTFEKFGHTSDANDYLMIEILKTEYLSYISGSKPLDYKLGKRAPSRRNTL